VLVAVTLVGGLSVIATPANAAGLERRHYSEHIAYKKKWSFQRWLEWRLARIREFRNRATHAIWLDDPDAVWTPREPDRCQAQLSRIGVEAQPMKWTATPVPTPVEIIGPIEGVEFVRKRSKAPFYLSCELAARLPTMARIFARHGVEKVHLMSAYRVFAQRSFHSMGLALDLSGFETDRGEVDLLEHFGRTPERPTCPAPEHDDWRAQLLADVSCELFETHRFSTVVTPNYNKGHWDHYHIDIRPDDPRLFVR
jgi:hypothetical protein